MPGQIADFLERYKNWLLKIDQKFDAVRAVYPAAVPCHGGCSQCCYSLFAIPAIDGFLLWQGIRSSRSHDELTELLNSCKRLFSEFKADVFPEAAIPFRVEPIGWREFDELVDRFQRPCPFLTNKGWCGVYEWRPRICRLAGTVFADPVTGVVINDFCPLAIDARGKEGFKSAPFDVSGMDGQMQAFREEFKYLLKSEYRHELRDGHTFPLAGVIEASRVSGI